MKIQPIIIGIILMLFMALLTGCIQQEQGVPNNGDTRLVNTEFLGGKYNACIFHKQIYLNNTWNDFPEINYTKNGIEYDGYYNPTLKNAINWINTNTTENCTILCWWDYGSMIEGYAERNVIARFGSLAMIDYIAMLGMFDEEHKKSYIESHKWSSNETIQELAMVLTTINISSNETRAIIQKYNVSYIFTISYDKAIAPIFLNAAGKNADEYYTDGIPNEKCNDLLIFKMWNDIPEISGLELIYDQLLEDGRTVRIFKFI